MRSQILLFLHGLLFIAIGSYAQTPVISYAGNAKTYTTGINISPLTPVNTGGSVPATHFGQVTTVAGNGTAGYADGNGSAASFNQAEGIAIDSKGNIFVADQLNNRIRKITPTGMVETFAGGTEGFKDGTGTSANFYHPIALAIDAADNLYVADMLNNRIRKVTPLAVVTTLAGDGDYASKDGTGTGASIGHPRSIALDAAGNIYVSEFSAPVVRKISPQGVVTTLAGNKASKQVSIDGVGASASFYQPGYLTTDRAGNIFVCDNWSLRKITPDGTVTTIAPGSFFSTTGGPASLSISPSGDIYFTSDNSIYVLSPQGEVNEVAGKKVDYFTMAGSDDGIGKEAGLILPKGMAQDGKGNLFVADVYNNLIRKIVITGYAINKPLPVGMDFNPFTGAISGAATVVTPATDYRVTAYNASGSGSYILNIATVANKNPPVISSFSPQNVSPGTLVTIKGTDLVNASEVYIGGAKALVISNSNTEIVAIALPQLGTGSISVTTLGGTSVAAKNFDHAPFSASFAAMGSKLTGAGSAGAANYGFAAAVSADGNTAIVGGNTDNSNAGAAWVYLRENDKWVQQGTKLIGTGAIGAAGQGIAVAISADGNTAAVGGNNDNDGTGAVWVYTRNGTSWTQQGKKLVFTESRFKFGQGRCVALSGNGNTLVVGGTNQTLSNGIVWIFNRVNGTWKETARFSFQYGFTSNNTIAVNAAGNTILIGSPLHNSGTGTAFVYKTTNGTWAQAYQIEPKGLTGAAHFGSSVAISADGNTCLISAPNDNQDKGSAWIYKSQYNSYSPDFLSGIKSPTGENESNLFGNLIAMRTDAGILVISGTKKSNATEQLITYKLVSGQYVQQANPLLPAGLTNAVSTGNALAMSSDGNIIVKGNHFDNASQGAVWLYKQTPLPLATTLVPTDVTNTGAVLKGTVNANGASASVAFEYSTSAGLSNAKIASISGKNTVAAADGSVNFSSTLTGLTRGQVYYFRINAIGVDTVRGDIKKFITESAPPVITSVSPAAGPPGTIVTINGQYLTGALSVLIGGVDATIVSKTNNLLTCMVMPGATKGNVQVTTSTGTVSGGSFTPATTSYPTKTSATTHLVGSYTPPTYLINETLVNISADGSTAVIQLETSGPTEKTEMWVYKLQGNAWVKQSNIPTMSTQRPCALSADGNTLVGKNGNQIVVYVRNGETWSQQASLTVPAIDGTWLAYAVLSADGNSMIVSTSGGAMIFTREGDVWSTQGVRLSATDSTEPYDGTTVTISADGNTAAFAKYNDNNYAGSIWVFKKNSNGVWQQQGQKFRGVNGGPYQSQGTSLALSADGNTLVSVGDSWYSGGSNDLASVFKRTGDSWKQYGGPLSFYDDNRAVDLTFGLAISADASTIIIGGNSTDFNDGVIYTFKLKDSVWKLVDKNISKSFYPTYLGYNIGMSADAHTLLSSGRAASATGYFSMFRSTPVVTTLKPTNITLAGATLNGSVDDNGNDAIVYFEYSDVSSLVNPFKSQEMSIAAGSGSALHSAVLTNLKSGTTYYYRIAAVSNGATTYGDQYSFVTTLAPVITAFSPPVAQVGTTVTLTGINFNNVTDVSFGDVKAAKFNILSSSVLTALVAPGTISGAIKVTNSYGTGTINGLQIFPVPEITGSTKIIEKGGNTTLNTAAGNRYTFQWIKDDKIIDGATTSSYVARTAGNYTVRVSLDSLSLASKPWAISEGLNLPMDNFTASAKNVTCRGAKDGSIAITAKGAYNYTAEIKGPGVNSSIKFTSSGKLENLSGGSYAVCITIDGRTDFKQCFTLQVAEPADLSVFSTINQQGTGISLTLSGASVYNVQLNGVVYSTTDSSLNLPLQPGKNQLNVTTDKACQGVVQRIISASDDDKPYPNPFEDIVYLNIGEKKVAKATVEIYSNIGLKVYSKEFLNPWNTIAVQLSNITMPGTYSLILSIDGSKKAFKIIKK
nr:IPT/TIG domain-containing protein [uncultured Mucilaginibacter sp.]